jgi:hypothetical protein
MTFQHGVRICRAHFYRQHHQEIVNNEHHVLWALAAIDGGGLACFATDNLVGNPLQTRAAVGMVAHLRG